MGLLTTHVLDTANGCPAAGVRIQLYRLPDYELLSNVITNSDGRANKPLLEDESFKQGRYELIFHTEAYFSNLNQTIQKPAFLDDVVIRFGIANAEEHYHVPLLVSPWSYSTYRGS